MPTFQEIINAEFDFAAIKDFLFKIYTHPGVSGWLDKITAFIDSFPPAAFAYAVALAAIGCLFMCLGKRFMVMPLAFVTSFAVGFAGGVTFVGPKLAALVGAYIPINPTVVGLVLGGIGAFLFVPIYYALLAGGSFYAVYLVIYPLSCAILGQGTGMIVGLGVGACVAASVMLFRKWFEMLGTSALGGYLVMIAANKLVLLPSKVNIAIWAVLALTGFVVQIKTRKKY